MVKQLLQNKKKLMFLLFGLLGLISVRLFENELFYDPFLFFFKSEFQKKPLPEINYFLLFINLFFRFVLNTFFSLIIIYVFFNDIKIVRFAACLFLIISILLLVVFFGILYFLNQPDYLVLFYIRRFLIQPLLLILFIPAFYYQKISR
ncbi:exosortase F system-associated membrane protein [Flavobacterium fragile]